MYQFEVFAPHYIFDYIFTIFFRSDLLMFTAKFFFGMEFTLVRVY